MLTRPFDIGEERTDDTQTFQVNFQASDNSDDIHNRIEECDRKAATIFDKFRLLMWKNFLLQRRHKMQTIVQILIPLLFTANLLFVRSLVKPEIGTQNTKFNAFDITELRPP